MFELPQVDALDFGAGAADHERSLSNYFYRSQAFDRACDPEICLVLGEKGAGKSAIFLMMKEMSQTIPELANPNFFIATTANLREHFHLLRTKLHGSISPVTLWKFYFASIAALQLLDTCSGPEADFLMKFIEHWEVNAQKFPGLFGATLKIPLKYAELQVGRPAGVVPTPLQLQEVFAVANRVLSTDSRTLWIALDELDKVAIDGAEGRNQSSELLSALMQTHSELYQLGQIRFKFFIRSDVYEGLTYVDKDHFSNAILRLKWEPEDLAIMLALRIAASIGGVAASLKLAEAEELIGQVFDWPENVRGFDQLLDELRDGRGSVIPRDLLNFAINAKMNQLRFDMYGTNKPTKGLISAAAVEKGLEEASGAKLTDFLTTFPDLHRKFLNLQGHASPSVSQKELQKLLNLPDKLNFDLAVEDFWRVGAIAKEGGKPVHLTEAFVIPPIYRRALNPKGREK
jgi:hypothetical protein